MASTPLTPRRTASGKRRGRPPGSTNAVLAARKAVASSEPPPKRRRYIPGGPGGGGRFIDEDGVVTQVVVGRSGSSGDGSVRKAYNGHHHHHHHHHHQHGQLETPTARMPRMPRSAADADAAGSSPLYARRERSTRTRIANSRYEPRRRNGYGGGGSSGRGRGRTGSQRREDDDDGDEDGEEEEADDDDENNERRFGSAAAVAAAVAQSEGYKPREERGWEEFHPQLDIETTFMVFRSDDVDGKGGAAVVPASTAVTAEGAASDGPLVNEASSDPPVTTTAPSEAGGSALEPSAAPSGPPTPGNNDTDLPAPPQLAPTLSVLPETPLRRRIGRPPRDLYGSTGYGGSLTSATTPKTPKVLPIHNQTPKERLDLKLPSYRKTDRILLFEGKTFDRYVDKSMMNVGYQETDVYIRPEHLLIKASDVNAEEELDAYHQLLAAAGSKGIVLPSLGSTGGGGGSDDIGGSGGGGSSITTTTGSGGSGSLVLPSGGAGSNGGVGRVEYDMDEQDDMWLSRYNAQRKANGTEPITREIFEITVTKIEKEWHALEKRIPKPNPKPPQTHRPRSSSAAAVNGEPSPGTGEEQDSKCAICDDGDCENTNAIVFCDGCDLAVHQDCYGVPFIPEGQWLCRKCQLIGRGIPTCIFCPNTDGAFKQTNSSKWAHMLCAMWIPETSLGNTTFMEPVMDVDKVPKTRWRLTCYICRQKMGACIQCSNKACYQAFHVTCARRSRLYLKMKNSQGALAVLDNSIVLKAFCDRHCPPDYTEENGVHQATRDAKRFYKRTMRRRIWADSRASALQMAAATSLAHPTDESQMTGARIRAVMGGGVGAGVGGGTEDPGGSDVVVTAAGAAGDKKKGAGGGQAAQPMWKLPSGAPVIPQAVFDIVETALQRFMLRRRREFVSEACRYWTLKREARRGAALLKRLQLQMETFTSMELTRRNFAAMGASGQARLERRVAFAEGLLRDLAHVRALADAVVARERAKLEAAELEQDFVDSCYFPVHKLLVPVVDKAIAYDKGVFRGGLLALQARLGARVYTNALPFARDVCDVIHRGINNLDMSLDGHAIGGEDVAAPPPAVVATTASAIPPSADPPPAYAEARDRKRLGKRILRAIQPMLEAAVRAEADMTHASAEDLLKELEGLVAASAEILPQPPQEPPQQTSSITVAEAQNTEEVAASAAAAAAEDVVMADVPDADSGLIVVAVGGGETDAGSNGLGGDGAADDVAVPAEEEMEVDGGNGEETTAVDAAAPSSDPPSSAESVPLTSGGSSASLAAKYGEPLTPPQSHSGSIRAGGGTVAAAAAAVEVALRRTASGSADGSADSVAVGDVGGGDGAGGDGSGGDDITITITTATPRKGAADAEWQQQQQQTEEGEGETACAAVDTLHAGGTLWHLAAFSLQGTTAAEARWGPGRDAVRSLSEDLTDMDDEELDGLGLGLEGKEASPATAAAEVAVAVDAAATPVPVTPKRRGAAAASGSVPRKGTRSSARRR